MTLQLLYSKCMPILLCGLEVCRLKKSDLSSLDFVVNRFFIKLFNTGNIDTVKQCQMEFGCQLPSDLLQKRRQKFLYKIDNN